jgi:hypothetical protein
MAEAEIETAGEAAQPAAAQTSSTPESNPDRFKYDEALLIKVRSLIWVGSTRLRVSTWAFNVLRRSRAGLRLQKSRTWRSATSRSPN